jgi:hypothetical protein
VTDPVKRNAPATEATRKTGVLVGLCFLIATFAFASCASVSYGSRAFKVEVRQDDEDA